MFDNPNPIARTAEMLEHAKEYAEEYLKGNPSVLLVVSSGLTQLINKLSFMSGRQTISTPTVEHPPITNFMGEEITYANKIKKADLTPAEADRLSYVEKVERLYAQFGSIAPQGLLNSYTLPEDQLVIRGVAKRAGVDGYEDRDIDEDFIEDIAMAIQTKATDDAQQAEIERKLAEGIVTTINPVTPPLEEDEDDEDEEEDDDNEEDEDTISPAGDQTKATDDAQQAGGANTPSVPQVPASTPPPASTTNRRRNNNR